MSDEIPIGIGDVFAGKNLTTRAMAIGNEAYAKHGGELATANCVWRVAGDKFTLHVGDANLVTPLEKHERKVLFRVLRRLYGQAEKQSPLFEKGSDE